MHGSIYEQFIMPKIVWSKSLENTQNQAKNVIIKNLSFYVKNVSHHVYAMTYLSYHAQFSEKMP